MSRPRFAVLLLFGCTIFISAFLLFLIQPIFAKLILPWFGGSAGVWTTCLVFFQTALLLGYLYAHLVASRLSPRVQVFVHSGLLIVALFLLPVVPASSWRPNGGANPAWHILLLLTAVLGLPYFLLSTTGPLLQSWYARKWPGSHPYRLFALSNAGALLALVAYPIWIEPTLPTRIQDVDWSAAFAGFALLCGATAWLSLSSGEPVERDNEPAEPPTNADRITWIALAAGGSMLLLSITNQMTQNVAGVPFLWILPLTIYLLSFILCFESSRWYRRGLFLRLLVFGLGSVGYSIYNIQETAAMLVALPILAVGLFFACMYCHGELSCMKPDGRYLTSFYLMIALGGALGAAFVGLAAPVLFSAIYELPVSLLFVAALALVLNWWGGWLQRVLWVAVTVAMALVLISEVRGYRYNAIVMTRNFYGALRVVQSPEGGAEVRVLYHGTVKHGEEFLAPERRMLPTSYYGFPSGIGLTLKYRGDVPKRVGVVGLGAGTLAAYSRPGDAYRFYEINPQVIALANSQFYFLSQAPGKVETVAGDARLSLESEPAQAFDVLAVDAFSGDAIPVHLLTREAFAVYFRHLKPDGVLAIHVSNQYLNLGPVVQQLASFYNYSAVRIRSAKNDPEGLSSATWILVTRNRPFLDSPEISDAAEPIPPRPGLRLWTDDYNNLLQVIRWVPGG
jgi:SAM-dependent methyltransferase